MVGQSNIDGPSGTLRNLGSPWSLRSRYGRDSSYPYLKVGQANIDGPSETLRIRWGRGRCAPDTAAVDLNHKYNLWLFVCVLIRAKNTPVTGTRGTKDACRAHVWHFQVPRTQLYFCFCHYTIFSIDVVYLLYWRQRSFYLMRWYCCE